MSPRWLPDLLRRIRALAEQGRVRLTYKALHELARLDPGLYEGDVIEVLAALRSSDFVQRLVSEGSGEWMYVFKPVVEGTIVYVKVIIRGDCVVISFHEDE